DNSTTRKFGGTGLGLSIAHRLVELMGGQIGVNSKLGQGSRFWFEIPTLKSENRVHIDLPDLTGLSVLIIEDHKTSQVELAALMQHMKAEAIIVSDAEEALALAVKRPFDVALADYKLPGMDGLTLLRKLHEIQPFMGMVLHTIQHDYAILQACKFVGARYLEKPASSLAIGDALKSATKRIRPQSSKPQRLLICEDNESVRDILQRQLSKLGVTADFAENGLQGWDILQQNNHTMLITDLHMPQMDGYGLVKTIRTYEEENDITNGDRLPVIAMTADVQLVHQQVYLQHGFDECLLKPVSIGQLKQLLIRWGLIQAADTSAAPTPAEEQPQPAAPPAPEPVAVRHDIVLPDQPVIDKEMAVDQFGAFDDDAIAMIKMFMQITTPQISDMDEAFRNADWLRLRNIAHSVKGAARSACCLQLGDVAENIQIMADGSRVDNIQMQQLHAAFDKAKIEAETL
ncbi:MAG TPA: response regulator, partial [Alphaproteobacteria bacterium]